MFSIILLFSARILSLSTLSSLCAHMHTSISYDRGRGRASARPRYKVYKITSLSKLPITDYMLELLLEPKIPPASVHFYVHMITSDSFRIFLNVVYAEITRHDLAVKWKLHVKYVSCYLLRYILNVFLRLSCNNAGNAKF